mgnify:CR=1 FL=1
MRVVRIAVAGLIGLVMIALAVANRETVLFSLDPFGGPEPFIGLSVPLFLVLFAGLLIGFAAGAMLTWMAERPHRRAARQSRKVIEKMEREQPGTGSLSAAPQNSQILAVGHND